GVVSALKQPFFSKNSKKDKHQNDVCLQSEMVLWTIFFLWLRASFSRREKQENHQLCWWLTRL
ncbi:hypothetical protein, partial [Streptococcus sp. SS-4456]|uniref:hypothetical protein n=1 Tax=Streptococcus sp. SS-4456 TaxID=3072286 RepID=UPI002FC897C1